MIPEGARKLKKVRGREYRQAASCLLCAIVAWRFEGIVGPSEFSGGTVTGPLLRSLSVSGDLFLVAVPLSFVFRRVAAAMALVAVPLSLPLYLYFIAPGAFQKLTGGEYKVPAQSMIVWDTWAMAGIAFLAIAAYICLRALAPTTSE